jgi:hypothetical protein
MFDYGNHSSPHALWKYIEKNPGMVLEDISEASEIKHFYKASTVKTVISSMCISGILIKNIKDKVRTYQVNEIFPDANKAISYMNCFRANSNESEDHVRNTFFTVTVSNKIESLRMEIFVRTGRFLSLSGLISFLFDSQKMFEDEYNKKVEELIHEYDSRDDLRNKETPTTIIEKVSPMKKLLNFFKNMSFSYP